jgi:hypothetical protein
LIHDFAVSDFAKPPMKFALKHPTKDKWATYDIKHGASFTAIPALRYVWGTPEAAHAQRRLYEQALHTGLLVQNAESSEILLPPYDERARKFRTAWSKLFPETTSEQFLVLDNCAGMQRRSR